MKLDPILAKAARLSRKKKYGEAIRTLEPEVVRYHDSFRYYYILAVSCLYAKDFGGALTYFKRAREIKMRDPAVLLGLAVLYLRRGDTGRAVDFYLEVQELDPKNKTARKALNIIRKYGDPEDLNAWNESGKLENLFPPLPELPRSFMDIFIPVLAGLTALGAAFLILVLSGVIKLSPGPDSSRMGYQGSELEKPERDEPVQTGGSFRFILTRQQILEGYEGARLLFSEFRDEAAKRELNRLIESNASEAIKNKARILISYTDVPGFDTLKDRFTYTEVSGDPVLYRDCHVIWRGMATNLDMGDDFTAFDLLVGYDTRSSLEGIVPVRFDFALAVNMDRPLEVLGRVVPSAGTQGSGLYLEGVALHQAGNLGAGNIPRSPGAGSPGAETPAASPAGRP